MSNRPSLGFGDDADETPAVKTAPVLDLTEFKPKPVARPDQESIAKAAEKANFKSREPKAVSIPAPAQPRPIRRRITGRSVQLNVKVRQETVDAFYAIADAQGWGLGETLEKAVELLANSGSKS